MEQCKTRQGIDKMKVWLDVLTPKQANLFAELHDRLVSKGCKTLVTTRRYREANELLELRGLQSVAVGSHGGGLLETKLLESSKRTTALVKIIEEYDPDVAISFSSPEAARVAFGLKIPHYCISDSPHAEAVCRLTIPLSQKLFSPWIIPLYAWKRYGMSARDVIRYRALDPMAWLSSHKKDPTALDELGLDFSKPIAVVRTSEDLAAYLVGRSVAGISTAMDIVGRMLDLGGIRTQIVVLPRYLEQGDKFKKKYGNRIIVPEHVIDATSLFQVASVFIGGGGTMSAEAAMMGVPVISYYPGEQTFVERFLVNYGLVERIHDAGRIAHRALAISTSREFREFYQRKSSKLVHNMEDPLKVILHRILK
jgi:predicted glycosyltransferase